jgi:hypothetical protein
VSSFLIPDDAISLIAMRLNQYANWTVENNRILTNQSRDESLQILYTRYENDTNKYTPSLYDAIAMGLAHELSGYSTATNVAKNDLYALYMQSVMTAQLINSKETPALSLSSSSWVDVRSTDNYGIGEH